MKIVVVGSCSLDYFTVSNRFPRIGETIIGSDFTTSPGGKGANQAVAAAKLGADVTFLGSVGKDSMGTLVKNNLFNHSINVEYMKEVSDQPTGIATILVAEEDNMIVIVKGANNTVSIDYVKENINVIEQADMVVLQLEIPLETVEYVVNLCHEKGIEVILNPAPAVYLSKDLLDKVTYITPNETELEIVFNDNVTEVLKRYPNKVIMTKGSHGVFYHNGEKIINVPSYKVDVVDTTGAGDSFNGALAYALLKGNTLYDAITFSNKAASKTVQEIGAQTSPTLKDLEDNHE